MGPLSASSGWSAIGFLTCGPVTCAVIRQLVTGPTTFSVVVTDAAVLRVEGQRRGQRAARRQDAAAHARPHTGSRRDLDRVVTSDREAVDVHSLDRDRRRPTRGNRGRVDRHHHAGADRLLGEGHLPRRLQAADDGVGDRDRGGARLPRGSGTGKPARWCRRDCQIETVTDFTLIPLVLTTLSSVAVALSAGPARSAAVSRPPLSVVTSRVRTGVVTVMPSSSLTVSFSPMSVVGDMYVDRCAPHRRHIVVARTGGSERNRDRRRSALRAPGTGVKATIRVDRRPGRHRRPPPCWCRSYCRRSTPA